MFQTSLQRTRTPGLPVQGTHWDGGYCKGPRPINPVLTVTAAHELTAEHWAGLALAVDGGREVYGQDGISKEVNAEVHSGSGEEPQRLRCRGCGPLAGCSVSGEQRRCVPGGLELFFRSLPWVRGEF